MKLAEEDVKLYYKLYNPLRVYANMKFDIITDFKFYEEENSFPKEFFECSYEESLKLREKLFGDPELIDSFIKENPANLSSEELEIINGWKNFVKGKFLIFRYLKNHTIFLDITNSPRAYGVLALYTDIEEMVGSDLPVIVDAVLLPFKNRIIYDGLLSPSKIILGRDMCRDFNGMYQEAKFRYGIIKSLNKTNELIKTDEEILRFYMRSERNREIYGQEIVDMIQDPELLKIYHQESEKSHARKYGRILHEIGVNTSWFAILGGIIIASGTTKEEVKNILNNILPDEKRDFAHVFQYKKKI